MKITVTETTTYVVEADNPVEAVNNLYDKDRYYKPVKREVSAQDNQSQPIPLTLPNGTGWPPQYPDINTGSLVIRCTHTDDSMKEAQ
jgi:hypothetical protein